MRYESPATTKEAVALLAKEKGPAFVLAGGTDLLVRIDYSTIDEIFSEFTRDINEGGLFIETEAPRATGTEVAMRFNLPGSNDPLQTVGRVAWVRSATTDEPAGMGIEFDELSEDDRTRINAMIRSLRNGPSETNGDGN